MDTGCEKFDAIKALKTSDEKAYKRICQTVREDGAYIEAGENDVLIVRKLESNAKAMGIFGYSFLEQNMDKIQGSIVEGKAPTYDTIADGSYAVSRPLYFYVKKAHVGVIPGIKEYLAEFTSEKAWGPEGYLADRGLIAMPDAERKKFAADAKNLTPLSM
jgi:phosphate transport system substrate-binding protein